MEDERTMRERKGEGFLGILLVGCEPAVRWWFSGLELNIYAYMRNKMESTILLLDCNLLLTITDENALL